VSRRVIRVSFRVPQIGADSRRRQFDEVLSHRLASCAIDCETRTAQILSDTWRREKCIAVIVSVGHVESGCFAPRARAPCAWRRCLG